MKKLLGIDNFNSSFPSWDSSQKRGNKQIKSEPFNNMLNSIKKKTLWKRKIGNRDKSLDIIKCNNSKTTLF